MAKQRGPGQKTTRPPRTNNVPRDDDPQNELTRAREAGGAKRMVPKDRDIGAVTSRRGRSTARTGGSDVAPTRRAAARGRERHRAERKVGRRAAGSGANSPRKGTSRATRGQLAEAARKADSGVMDGEAPSRSRARTAPARPSRARSRDDQS